MYLRRQFLLFLTVFTNILATELADRSIEQGNTSSDLEDGSTAPREKFPNKELVYWLSHINWWFQGPHNVSDCTPKALPQRTATSQLTPRGGVLSCFGGRARGPQADTEADTEADPRVVANQYVSSRPLKIWVSSHTLRPNGGPKDPVLHFRLKGIIGLNQPSLIDAFADGRYDQSKWYSRQPPLPGLLMARNLFAPLVRSLTEEFKWDWRYAPCGAIFCVTYLFFTDNGEFGLQFKLSYQRSEKTELLSRFEKVMKGFSEPNKVKLLYAKKAVHNAVKEGGPCWQIYEVEGDWEPYSYPPCRRCVSGMRTSAMNLEKFDMADRPLNVWFTKYNHWNGAKWCRTLRVRLKGIKGIDKSNGVDERIADGGVEEVPDNGIEIAKSVFSKAGKAFLRKFRLIVEDRITYLWFTDDAEPGLQFQLYGFQSLQKAEELVEELRRIYEIPSGRFQFHRFEDSSDAWRQGGPCRYQIGNDEPPRDSGTLYERVDTFLDPPPIADLERYVYNCPQGNERYPIEEEGAFQKVWNFMSRDGWIPKGTEVSDSEDSDSF